MNPIVIGLLGHVDAGKTTLCEALLYAAKAIRTLGRVDNKNTFLDTDAMERARGITIFAKQARFTAGAFSITLLDTPGHVDFSAETERTLQVLDYAILIVSALDGVTGHTETLWKLLARYDVPVFLFVNKTDQSGTDQTQVFEQMTNKLSGTVVDFSIPSRIDYDAVALCDETLLDKHLAGLPITADDISELIWDRKLFPCFFGSALRMTGIGELSDGLAKYVRCRAYDAAFGAKVYKISRDEKGSRLTHLKVTGGTLTARMTVSYGCDDLAPQSFAQGVTEEKINQIRIYSGEKFSAVNEVCAGEICAVTGLEHSYAGQSLGSDEKSLIPLLAPVLTYRLLLPAGTDALAFLPKIRHLEEEDPQLHVVWNELTREIYLQVMGAVQIEILQNIIKNRFGIDVSFGPGKIVYKETIRTTVEGVGHFEPLRHYAEVHLIIEPGECGSGIVIQSECSEDSLDRNWQRLIFTHLSERTHCGVLTGAPLTDVVITLVSGRAHQKHTEGGDFRQAVYRAVRQGLMQAESVLLEPYYAFSIEVPTCNVGRTLSDLERMTASFAMESPANGHPTDEYSVITGTVPVSAFGDYQTELMAYTKGKGKISLQTDGYKPCRNQAEVVAAIGYDADRDTANPSSSVFCSHGAGVTVPWNEVFLHMHLESVLARRLASASFAADSSDFCDESRPAKDTDPRRLSRTVSDTPLSTEEIDAILRQTYYSNSREHDKRRRRMKKSPSTEARQYTAAASSSAPNQKTKPKISYLLVDGYNIIFAWEELKTLAKENLDAARGRLLDILCNYQAMTKCELIVVFDAYRVLGHDTEFLDYHNIHVVYTKEAETADRYIERFAHEHGRKHDVRVATSDGLEQIIIIGQGCRLVSAREFEQEVKETERYIRTEFLDKSF